VAARARRQWQEDQRPHRSVQGDRVFTEIPFEVVAECTFIVGQQHVTYIYVAFILQSLQKIEVLAAYPRYASSQLDLDVYMLSNLAVHGWGVTLFMLLLSGSGRCHPSFGVHCDWPQESRGTFASLLVADDHPSCI